MTFECATNETFECATTEAECISLLTYPSVIGPVSTGNGILSLNLTATSEVNGTNVICNATTGTNNEVTAPAYLYVQGQYNTFIYSKYYYFLPDVHVFYFLSLSQVHLIVSVI